MPKSRFRQKPLLLPVNELAAGTLIHLLRKIKFLKTTKWIRKINILSGKLRNSTNCKSDHQLLNANLFTRQINYEFGSLSYFALKRHGTVSGFYQSFNNC